MAIQYYINEEETNVFKIDVTEPGSFNPPPGYKETTLEVYEVVVEQSQQVLENRIENYDAQLEQAESIRRQILLSAFPGVDPLVLAAITGNEEDGRGSIDAEPGVFTEVPREDIQDAMNSAEENGAGSQIVGLEFHRNGNVNTGFSIMNFGSAVISTDYVSYFKGTIVGMSWATRTFNNTRMEIQVELFGASDFTQELPIEQYGFLDLEEPVEIDRGDRIRLSCRRTSGAAANDLGLILYLKGRV